MTQLKPTHAANECNDYYHRYVRRQKANKEALEGSMGTFLFVVIAIGIVLLIAVKS